MEIAEIFDKLQAVADRYDELNELISDPEVIADSQRFMKLSKEEGSLRETVEKYKPWNEPICADIIHQNCACMCGWYPLNCACMCGYNLPEPRL